MAIHMQSLPGNKIASRTNMRAFRVPQGVYEILTLDTSAGLPTSLCLLVVEVVMQSGRVVATLAFGGEEKLTINIPATGVYCRFFFM